MSITSFRARQFAVLLATATFAIGCSEGTAPASSAPVAVSMQPESVVRGADVLGLVVQGSNFTPASVIRVNGQARPTTYVSPYMVNTSLPASDLATAGTREVTVFTPAPGGGVSAPRILTVENPAPFIAAFNVLYTLAGQPSFPLRVVGNGLDAASVVHVNGSPRPTRVAAIGSLEVTLSEADLRTPGMLNIIVVNPSPGGGASPARLFAVVAAAVEITRLPSQGALAGSASFPLYVHGLRFSTQSVVRWNGADRPTEYLSETRLRATISAADVAQPGTAQVTVAQTGAEASVSPRVPFTVHALGASTVTERFIPVVGHDFAYDPTSNRFFVSTLPTFSANPNSIVAFDAATGAQTAAVSLGSEPNRVAISDDGTTLYAGLDAINNVRRVALNPLAAGTQWALPTANTAGDLAVMPGTPNTVAIARHGPNSPSLQGVTIYDNGVARGTSSPGHTGGSRIEFLDSPNTLFGYDNVSSASQLFTIAIDGSGARHASAVGGLISENGQNILGAFGRIYAMDGSIVDAERTSRIGSFGQASIAMAVDARMGRAYLLTAQQILVYDLNTFARIGALDITRPLYGSGQWPRMVRFGVDGLAVLDGSRLMLFQSPLIGAP